jgi:xanthine dehydrogenase accessory factor
MPGESPPILARTAPPEEVLRAALAALDAGRRVILASVVARHGSAPSTPGQKLVLLDERTALGSVGGGAVERVVLEGMLAALRDPLSAPKVATFRLGASLGMCCGGSADILVEPLDPPRHVIVVGAGHVGVFTAPLLASLGFRVTLVDAREGAAEADRLAPLPPAPTAVPEGVRLVHAEHDDPEVRAALPADCSRAALLVMTHDHQLDQAVVEWGLRLGFGFVGGVGSRAKAVRTRDRLEAKGFSAADMGRVRMPVGMEIGARSPAEIGVSIAGELVRWRGAEAREHAAPAAREERSP